MRAGPRRLPRHRDAGSVHAAVTFLLDHLPHQMHLVIATRSDPPLPLARLRTGGQLTEAARRRPPLHRGRVDGVPHARDGAGPAAADVRALEGRTEGWIAGLQLAALSCAASGSGATSPASSTRSRAATGSCSTTSPTRSSPGCRTATTSSCCSTAVLERLTGPLCDAVTGGDDATRMLEDLERANLFLVPLDTAALVPLPPPLRRRAARTSARRARRPGAGAAPQGEHLARLPRAGRGRRPARARRRGLRRCRPPGGAGAAGAATRAAGQPAPEVGEVPAGLRGPPEPRPQPRRRLVADAVRRPRRGRLATRRRRGGVGRRRP